MTWLVAILAAFAIYRAARMVAEEDGPGFVFKRVRDRFSNDKRAFDVGLRCVYCIGFWVALPVVVMVVAFADWDWRLFPIWWLGLAGAAAKIHEYWNTKR